MYLLFRSLMVIVFFLVWMALWQATALAVLAAGPLATGMALADLPSLMPTGQGTPSPFVIAAGLTALGNLLLAMTAMLIAEHVFSVGRFVAACLKAAFILMLMLGIPFGAYLFMGELPDAEKLPPLVVFALAMLGATLVTAFVLAWPFLAWVSERPRRHDRRSLAAPPAPGSEAVFTAAERSGPATTDAAPTAAPEQTATAGSAPTSAAVSTQEPSASPVGAAEAVAVSTTPAGPAPAGEPVVEPAASPARDAVPPEPAEAAPSRTAAPAGPHGPIVAPSESKS